MERKKIKDLILCALFVCLISIGAFIKIPIPVVPFTLQFLFTTLAGILLGGKLGAFSVLIYTLMGLLGFPIFAGGGSFSYILKPTFGYIIGFIVGAYYTGKITHKYENPSYKRILIANFVGLSIVYIFGMIYYYFISKFYLGNDIGVYTIFIYCFVLAVPGDIFLCIVGAIVGKKLISILKKGI